MTVTPGQVYPVDSINPLSPNIHLQILQTDLGTFPFKSGFLHA